MKKNRGKNVNYKIFIWVSFTFIFFGCTHTDPNTPSQPSTISGQGTIVQTDQEGGFYGIVMDDGIGYRPINLAPRFQIDDLKIHFEGELVSGKMGIDMWRKIKLMNIHEQNNSNVVTITGVVKFIELEGGFYGVVSSDGKQYRPDNLPENYKRDGAAIHFQAEVMNDMMGIQMWGTSVQITRVID